MPGGRCTVTDTPSGGCQKNSMRMGCRPGSTWILTHQKQETNPQPTKDTNKPSTQDTIQRMKLPCFFSLGTFLQAIVIHHHLKRGDSSDDQTLMTSDDSEGLFHLQQNLAACSPCKPRPPNVKRPPSSESIPWRVEDDGNTRSHQVRPETASWQLGLSKKQIALFSKTRKMYSPPRLIRK